MNYCLGFLTDASGTHVLLMEKRRPSWQAGRLNGIGGKVEEGEDALGAMRRECQEETGLEVVEWSPLGAISFEGGQVHVFHAQADLSLAQSTTDEPVRQVTLADAIQGRSWSRNPRRLASRPDGKITPSLPSSTAFRV